MARKKVVYESEEVLRHAVKEAERTGDAVDQAFTSLALSLKVARDKDRNGTWTPKERRLFEKLCRGWVKRLRQAGVDIDKLMEEGEE
jgi:hypothetical protein